jgi:hypothetical protein
VTKSSAVPRSPSAPLSWMMVYSPWAPLNMAVSKAASPLRI